jgi:hypothetical protein
MASIQLALDSYTHSWVLRATRSIIHHHSSCQVIKIQVNAKRLSWCIRTWCSILLKWRLELVTLGDWQDLGGLGDRSPSELAVMIVEAQRRSWWPCSWFELHHAGDGEQRLLVSALILVTWEVTRPLVGVTTWIRGVCQIIDTTEKILLSLLLSSINFQVFTLCLLLCLVSLSCLCHLLRVACLFFN